VVRVCWPDDMDIRLVALRVTRLVFGDCFDSPGSIAKIPYQ